jgi:hypothetical protein
MQKLQDIQQMYENRNQVATTLGVFQHDPYLSTALSSTGDSEANSPFRIEEKVGLLHWKITLLLLGHIEIDSQFDIVAYDSAWEFCRDSEGCTADRCGSGEARVRFLVYSRDWSCRTLHLQDHGFVTPCKVRLPETARPFPLLATLVLTKVAVGNWATSKKFSTGFSECHERWIRNSGTYEPRGSSI